MPSLPRRLLTHIGAISLRTRIMVLVLATMTGAVTLLTAWQVDALRDHERNAVEERLERNMLLFTTLLEAHGTGWRQEGDRLFHGSLTLNGANAIPDQVKAIGSGVATIFAGETRIATNVQRPDGGRAVGTTLGPGPALEAVRRGQEYRGEAVILGRPHLSIYRPVRDAAGRQVGIIFVGVDLAGIEAATAEATQRAVILGGVLLLVVGIGLWLLLGWLFRPLRGLAGSLERIGAGQLETEVPCLARQDELGHIGRAVAALRDRTRDARAAQDAADAARAAAQAERNADRTAAADQLEQRVGGIADRLAQAAAQLRQAAEEASASGARSASRAQEGAGRVAGATANVQAVAAAAEELAASVAEITRQVAESARTAQDASAAARASDTTVASLSEAATRIGDVVRLISDIAGQTNLLALNATIEAARAGEAGKGFAVVAGEVKSLAAQTAKATEEIAAQIAAMRGATDQAVGAVRGIADAVGRMEEVTSAIAAAVEQQGAATQEIARNAAEAASGTQDAAAEIARLTEDMAASTASVVRLREAGTEVDGHGAAIREEVAGFARQLRAA